MDENFFFEKKSFLRYRGHFMPFLFLFFFMPFFLPIFGIFFTFWAIRGILTINTICAEKMRQNGQGNPEILKKYTILCVFGLFLSILTHFGPIYGLAPPPPNEKKE